MDTPEFVIWAIEFGCLVRGQQDGRDPDKTERQLRAARAVSDATREGRLFEGFCVAPPLAFRASDALDVYGGLDAVESACRSCPANVLASIDAQAWAGCFGIIALRDDEAAMHAAIERVLDERRLGDEFALHFEATAPRWYGLWMRPIAARPALLMLAQLCEGWKMDSAATANGIAELLAAANAAASQGLRIHAALYPRGRVENKRWRLVPHCARCRAPWPEPGARQCRVCGGVGRPAPEKRRLARGERPYFPLDRLLSPAAAAEFLLRYRAYRAARAGADGASSLPVPAPPDSPRGG